MVFKPIAWKTGDILTADKLNGMIFYFSEDDIQTGAPMTQAEGAVVLDIKGDLYQVQAGVAALLGSFVGPAGPAGGKGDAGEKGATGANGKGIKGLALVTTDGKVTGGTLTFDDDTNAVVNVTEAPK
ncbi:MAG: hypothetical protein LKF36_05520 [Lactobacillus sp.]|jgi:hypothetical protein|nr:hypothetical protein [Lactobacillus sp.]